jgi:hypothetical protein
MKLKENAWIQNAEMVVCLVATAGVHMVLEDFAKQVTWGRKSSIFAKVAIPVAAAVVSAMVMDKMDEYLATMVDGICDLFDEAIEKAKKEAESAEEIPDEYHEMTNYKVSKASEEEIERLKPLVVPDYRQTEDNEGGFIMQEVLKDAYLLDHESTLPSIHRPRGLEDVANQYEEEYESRFEPDDEEEEDEDEWPSED